MLSSFVESNWPELLSFLAEQYLGNNKILNQIKLFCANSLVSIMGFNTTIKGNLIHQGVPSTFDLLLFGFSWLNSFNFKTNTTFKGNLIHQGVPSTSDLLLFGFSFRWYIGIIIQTTLHLYM